MRVFLVALLALSSALCAGLGSAQTVHKGGGKAPFTREVERSKANQNLLVLMGGGLGGPYLQLAHDIAVAVNDGDSLRVLPVASDGAFTNVRDIVLLKGVDLAITTVQILNALKASGEYGNIEQQVAYIAPLSVDTFHVLARPEINSIQDLQGKKVSFNTKGSGTARFGPTVLKALGVTVAEATMAQGDALQAMRSGELDATLCSCPLPVPPFGSLQPGSGFKFLDVPYIPALEQDYVPANLTGANYPGLIAKDSRVQTIATSTILITFNWPRGTERYRKVEKFVNAFFSNFDKLKEPARHPAWRSVNLGAIIRGWQRFPTAQQWLDRQAAEAATAQKSSAIDAAQARAHASKAAPHDLAEQERLFKEFMEWTKNRPKR
jgi:TRAP transporter TAXI family solute receptor